MKRFAATILLALFSWMLALSAFALPAGATLPACCRKTGQHKCGMPMQDTAANADLGLVSAASQCPCNPGSAGALHFDAFTPSPASAIYAGLMSHPAGSPQTDADYRVSSLRSRQKRGPPSLLFCNC